MFHFEGRDCAVVKVKYVQIKCRDCVDGNTNSASFFASLIVHPALSVRRKSKGSRLNSSEKIL